MIDVSEFKEVYEWWRVNNPNFANFKEFDDCPSPILVEDKNSLDEESENSTLEKQIKIQYPNDTLKKMLFTIVLNHFNEHDYHHRKGCLKRHQSADSII